MSLPLSPGRIDQLCALMWRAGDAIMDVYRSDDFGA